MFVRQVVQFQIFGTNNNINYEIALVSRHFKIKTE